MDTLNQRLIEEYTSYLLKKGLEGKTVATYICSLRTILYFLMQKGYVDPFKIKKPKFNDVGGQMSDSCLTASILIGMIVIGIWFIKNGSEKESIAGSDNPDFELEATSLDLDQLKSYGLPIIIDFGSDSCIPCKEMAPVLQKLNSELRGKVIVKFVDVWKYPDLAEGYPISVIPTQLFFDSNGKPYVPSDPQSMGMKLYQKNDTKEHIFTTHEGGMTMEQFMDVLSEMGIEE